MRKLYLILGEAGLELVPRELWSHRAVRRYAEKRGKRPGEVLLDISYHYSAMRGLKDWRKRGRPDIVHVCLLEALESPLNKEGLLEVYVHTYDGKVVRVDPEVRVPRHYLRFVGLMEQLLAVGRVPPRGERALMEVESVSLKELVGRLSPSTVLLLEEGGERLKLTELSELLVSEERPALVVGAFQAGQFSEKVRALADRSISIYGGVLSSWVVVSRILAALEMRLGIV